MLNNVTNFNMNKSLLLNWINAVYQENRQTGNRAAIVLSGESLFCIETVRCFINHLRYESVIWVSPELEHAIVPEKARMLLGRECDALVYDAGSQFNIDAFGAVSGIVKSKGMIFLLVPDRKKSASYLSDSRFFNRALNSSHKYSNVYFLEKNSALPDIHQCQQNIVEQSVKVDYPFRTLDQQRAVQAIIKHIAEKKIGIIALTSDRGRGKSSSLGLAAGMLLQQPVKKIIITAPRLSNSAPVFHHAKEISSAEEISAGKIIFNDASIEFIAPDILLEKKPAAEAVFVDEASAIPLPMLEKMLDAFPLIVFSTTVHGYEGTGRGFALKFNKVLDIKKPGWQKIELDTPIRWIKNDPVEKWIGSMLCMNAELPCVAELNEINKDECNFQLVNRDKLLKDESKLTTLFALLVYAHYRTQPSDLVYMLDSDSIRIYTLELNNKILAVTLINEEGGFDKSLSSQIYKGERRPQGHLLAQTLSFHAGFECAASLKYARVMRIAVHPELQRQGLGSYLLQQVINQEQVIGMDAIGSSFGATVELLNFWNRLSFEIVRTGFTRDHASGTHSAVMLKVLNKQTEDIFEELRHKFRSYIKDWLSDSLKNISLDMKQYLNNNAIDNDGELTEYEWKDIKSFINTHRGYEVCMPALIKLIKKYDKFICHLNEQQQILIAEKIQQLKSWPEVVKKSGVTGKGEAVEYLRVAVKELLIKAA